ncbi:MAG TPA: aminoglycoside phosphotransferase family protein [Dehalococcoidia bacterium]|nr:aminoglycoside phosphotransferase family protein [Dehalococcoidia bacterium]
MVLRDADIYFQPDATDPVLADDLVLSLVRRHVPAARAVTGIDETGGEARVYEIDDDVIFKTQRPHRARDRTSLKKEVFFLGQLASDAEVSVPKVLGYGRESEHIEYTCMTRMPGVTLRSVDCEGETRRQVFRAVGQMLRRIHSLPQQPFVENELLPGDRAAGDVRRRFEALYANAVRSIGEQDGSWPLRETPEALAQRVLAAFPESDDRVALHSNPTAVHIFVDGESCAFEGLIDFGDAYISHPAFDLRQRGAFADRADVLKGYTADEPVSDQFMATWRAVMVLTTMTAIPALRPEHRGAAEQTLRDLLNAI